MGKSLYYCGSTERNRQVMVSTFWIDSSESSQQALGYRDYPWWSGTWPWVIGGQGEIGVQSESLLGVDVQSFSPVCLFSTL